jgi:putative transposase
MARPLRLLYSNAWYHVINRGAAKVTIFHSSDDYQTFICIFNKLHSRYHFEIHSYCLMPNHYHILIRTPLPNLNYGMQYLNLSDRVIGL